MLWVKIMQSWLARVLTKAESGARRVFARIESAYDTHPMETCVATTAVIFLFVALVLVAKN